MYINENTRGTFILHADIRYECWKDGKELPGILTDEVLAANGYYPVVDIPTEYDRITQKLVPLEVIKNASGVWEQRYRVDELDAATISNNRNINKVERIEWNKELILRGNVNIISAVLANDTVAIDAWKAKAAELQAQIQSIEQE